MKRMELDFEGRTVLITGAATGIGRATALAFAAARAAVLIGDVDPRAEDTVREISASGGKAAFQKTDVSDSAQVKALVARAVSEFGTLDVAFNNAGLLPPTAPLAEQAPLPPLVGAQLRPIKASRHDVIEGSADCRHGRLHVFVGDRQRRRELDDVAVNARVDRQQPKLEAAIDERRGQLWGRSGRTARLDDLNSRNQALTSNITNQVEGAQLRPES